MSVKVIINPVAGRGKSMGRWKKAERELIRLGVSYVPFVTSRVGHARELAATVREEGYSAVMSVGGDGTLNEVLNGLAGKGVPVAVVSTGTGNDFIRSAGIPADPALAARLVSQGKPTPVDIGRFGSRYFINAAGIGFDAEIAHTANTRFRHLRGAAPYVMGLLTNIGSYKPASFEMTFDQVEVKFKAWVVSVTNGQFYGGGMKVVPGANISDGRLDVCIIGSFGRFELLGTFPKVFSGRHITHPKVSLYRTTRVHVKADRKVRIQTDGEVFEGDEFAFEIIPGGVDIFLPDQPSAVEDHQA